MTMRYIQKGLFVKKAIGVDFEDWTNPKIHILMEPIKTGHLLLVQKLPDRKEMLSATLPFSLVQKLFNQESIWSEELDNTGLATLTWDDKKMYLSFSSEDLTPMVHVLHLYEILAALPELFSERKLRGLPEEKPTKKKWQFWLKEETK